MKKFKLMLALLAAPSMVLASCGGDNQEDDPAVVEEGVTSVSVSCSKKKLGIGETVKAKATVKVVGDVDKSVTWSSSKESVATVDSTGKITAIAVGTAKITATSVKDGTKSGSVTITVVNEGPRPELLEEGFEYSSEWPAAKIKSYCGIDTPTFEDLEGGVYIYEYEGDEEEGYAPYLEIIIEDTEDNYYGFYEALDGSGWHYHYDDYYGTDAYIDPTKKVEVDLSEVDIAGEDAEDYDYVLNYFVYRTEDIWGSAEDTTDTAWESELASALAAMGIELPFVKLGAEYEFDDSEGMIIFDYSPDYDKLNGYDAVLKGAGFTEKGSEAEGFWYEKAKDDYSTFVVEFGFTGYGNTIMISEELIELAEFPAAGVAKYIEDHKSTMSLPAFSGSEAVSFTFARFFDEEDEEVELAQIGLNGATETECEAYIASLLTNGFKIVSASDEEEGYYVADLQKGKLCVEAVMSYWKVVTDEAEIEAYFDVDVDSLTDEEYEEMYYNYLRYIMYGYIEVLSEDMQEAWATLSIDASAHEVPGLYYNGKGVKVAPEADFTLEVEVFELGEAPVLSYVSDHPEIATVSDAGVVHGVAEGECKITVSTTVNETPYSVEVPVVVSNVQEFALTIAPTAIGTSGAGYAKTDGDHVVAVGEASVTLNSSYVCNQNGAIQFKASSSATLTTKNAFPGEIVSIVLPVNTLDVYIGANQASQSKITPVACDGGFLYEAPAGSTYFTIVNSGSKAVQVASIIVNYLG